MGKDVMQRSRTFVESLLMQPSDLGEEFRALLLCVADSLLQHGNIAAWLSYITFDSIDNSIIKKSGYETVLTVTVEL